MATLGVIQVFFGLMRHELMFISVLHAVFE